MWIVIICRLIITLFIILQVMMHTLCGTKSSKESWINQQVKFTMLQYWQRFVNYFLHVSKVLGFKIKYSCPTMALGPYFLFSGSSNDNFFHSKSKWGFMAIPVVEFFSREGYNIWNFFDQILTCPKEIDVFWELE